MHMHTPYIHIHIHIHIHMYICICIHADMHSCTLHATRQVPVARYAMQPGWMTGVLWSPVGEALLAATDAPAIVLQLLQAPRTSHLAPRTSHLARVLCTSHTTCPLQRAPRAHSCIRAYAVHARMHAFAHARACTTGHQGGVDVQPRHGGEQHILGSVGALAQRVWRPARRGELRRAA